jgi:lysophospholipase L1-like esterase
MRLSILGSGTHPLNIMSKAHKTLSRLIGVAAVFSAVGVWAAAPDISLPGNQFARQFVNGYALTNVNTITDDQLDDAVFPDNMGAPGWAQANIQNITISAGTYKTDDNFDQHWFKAIDTIRIWALCAPGQEMRIPRQVTISYTTDTAVRWNNWYSTGDKSLWPFPTTIDSVNGKPATANADGSVTLYDGKTNNFTGTLAGTKYCYVDLGVDIPAGTSSVMFQFGPQVPGADSANKGTFGALIAEIQTVPTDAHTAAPGPENIVVKTGQKVAFLGDSITALGWEKQDGYVRLVAIGLAVNGVKSAPVPAGVSGNTSGDERVRFDTDIVNKKPDWFTLSCGVNDVWHNPGGVPLDQYEKNITEMCDKADAAGVKVVILTATMIGEDQENGNNQKLIPYNEFLRNLAKERKYPLADLNANMQAQVQEMIKDGWKPGHLLTIDGVHMNPHGNMMMASGILKAMGLNDAQLAKAQDTWLDMPHGWSTSLTYQITIPQDLTLRQYLQIQKKTPKGSDGSVPDLLQSIYTNTVPGVLFPDDKNGLSAATTKLMGKMNQAVDDEIKK